MKCKPLIYVFSSKKHAKLICDNNRAKAKASEDNAKCAEIPQPCTVMTNVLRIRDVSDCTAYYAQLYTYIQVT